MKKEFNKNNTLAIKGIAIIMMIIHHSIVYKGNFNVSFFPFNEKFIMDLSIMFRICVSLFVFLSGYGLYISYKSKKNESDLLWVVKRLLKLYAGFWIVVILSFIICECISGYTSQVFFKNGIVKGLIQMFEEFFCLTIKPTFNGHWWYMNIAILYICSIPIFEKIFNRYNYILVLFIVIILPRILMLNINRSCYIAFLFPLLLGMIFAKEKLLVKIANLDLNKNKIINKSIKFIVETILIVVCFVLYKNMNVETYYEINYGIIPVFIICYLYEFYLDMPILKNILAFLGQHSMNMYFIHYFVRLYTLNWLYSFENWLLISLALLVASLVLSIVIEIFKKLIGYNKIFDRIQLYIEKKFQEKFGNKKVEEIKELETI